MNQEQNNLQSNTSEGNGYNTPVSKNTILVLVVAIVVVVLALMYVWGSNVEKRPSNAVVNNEPALPTEDLQLQTLKQVSTSDELDAIEQDLQATELENIDADVEQMEKEIAE